MLLPTALQYFFTTIAFGALGILPLSLTLAAYNKTNKASADITTHISGNMQSLDTVHSYRTRVTKMNEKFSVGLIY